MKYGGSRDKQSQDNVREVIEACRTPRSQERSDRIREVKSRSSKLVPAQAF